VAYQASDTVGGIVRAERGSTPAERGGRFPTIDTVSLTGRPTRLPDDLAGTPVLVLLAFQRWQQELIDGWRHPLARLRHEVPGFDIYEVAIVPRVFLPARALIDRGMTRAIPQADIQSRTLTAYVNVSQEVQALGLPGPENIALRLLDSSGRIVWSGRGVYDPDQIAALREALLRPEARAATNQEAP